MRNQWSAFEQLSDCRLDFELEAFELHALYDALFEQKRIASGDFDLVLLNTDWVAAAHATGCVLNLATRITENPPEGYPDGWTQSLLRLQSIDGVILGVPYHDGPECLIIRRDLFQGEKWQREYADKFGTTLRVPETWEEFHQVARFFHRPDEGLWGTAFAGFPDCHNTVYDFMLQLWTRGGELVDESGRVRFYSPQAVAALEFYRAIMQDREAVHPDSLQFDSVQLGQAFANGQIAMMVNWFGFAAWAETSPGSRVRGRIDLAPVPHAPGCNSASLSIYWLLAIAAGCPRPELAYLFLRHCVSPSMDRLLTLEGAVGCRKSTWSDVEVCSVAPHFNLLEPLHAHARELPRLAEWPSIATLIDAFVRASAVTQDPIEELLMEADAKLAKGKTSPVRGS
ncbi:MAG: extracellular solute-binding protein [Terracidiphilus sp.]